MADKLGIQIAKTLKSKLPDEEKKQNIEKILRTRAGGKCFLCGGDINEATHRIVVDHDVPEAEGGKTELKNLNLVHASCNSWKRNHPTAPAKHFLPFKRFIEEERGAPVYADCLSYFGLKPKNCSFSRSGSKLTIEFPDNTKQSVEIISEKNPNRSYDYCFVEVPISVIFNDKECQPRTIKPKQVWSIFSDLHKNPLHEPPSCRVEKPEGSAALLMFDGQHKTIASLLMKRERIAIKIYLSLDSADTRHLVNSIQAKIPKLPLSAMELMAKMGMEYSDRLAEYLEHVGDANASEGGFLKWLPADERRRGKQAFENACIQSVWEEEGLDLHEFVGEFAPSARRLTESAAKGKLLRPLVHVKPLDQRFEESEAIRVREKELVTRLLDYYVSQAFRPRAEPPEDEELEAARRRMYQSSLAYVSGLIRKVAAHLTQLEEGDCLGVAKPKKDQGKKIEQAIKRIIDHPVWTHSYAGERMIAVRDALSKNQNADKAFKDVRLDIGYALTGELPGDWATG